MTGYDDRARRTFPAWPPVLALVLLATSFVAVAASTPASAETLGQYTTFSDGVSDPQGIASGPDGNLWFTNHANNLIGVVTPDGSITTHGDPTISGPEGIAAGPDGALWFTNATGNSIGRITVAGAVTNFTDGTISGPEGIAAGPDGALWFTNATGNSIGRITVAGAVTNFTDVTISGPEGIAAGPDGALWFTNATGNSIGRITVAGAVTDFTAPTISGPRGITAGPDGNLWFTNPVGPGPAAGSIGRITTAGTVTDFTDGDIVLTHPQQITAGPDGKLWFTSWISVGALQRSSVGNITTAGVITRFATPNASFPEGITTGSDGNLWFANSGSASIGRSTPSGSLTTFTAPPLDARFIVAGADGNLWFTDHDRNAIGRVTPSGTLTSFTGHGIDGPLRIAEGRDGNVWFTSDLNNSIGRITPAGAVTIFARPGPAQPRWITAGPDGNVWFTNTNDNTIERITSDGDVTTFTGIGIDSPEGITAGPDGKLWFTNAGNNSIGVITTAGVVTNQTPAGVSGPSEITTGPDGNLWIIDGSNGADVARLSPSGTVAHFASGVDLVGAIVSGPDGNLWFTGRRTVSSPTASTVRMTTTGATTFFDSTLEPVPGAGLAAGPDGSMWLAGGPVVARLGTGLVTPGTPGPPTSVAATGADRAATVNWEPPASSGVAPVLGYTVTASPGGQQCTSSGPLTCVVNALDNWSSYSFTVRATNVVGTGPPSISSSSTVPHSGSLFNPVAVTRILDTRPDGPAVGPFATPWGPGETRVVDVRSLAGLPPAADAVAVNVTFTNTTAVSFATIWPADAPMPLASSQNWASGDTVATAATVGLSPTGELSIFNSAGATDVIIDIAGYFDTTGGNGYSPLAPSRILDSRPNGPQVGPNATPWGPGESREVEVRGHGGVAADAVAVVVNVTVTDTTSAGHLTAFPAGTAMPLASNLNWAAGQTAANATTATIGADGAIAIYNATGSTNVIVDVAGYYAPGHDHPFHSVLPTRVLDSRPTGPNVGLYSTPWQPNVERDVAIAGSGPVPPNAVAAVVNVTVTNPSGPSFLSVYTAGPPPLVSTLNWIAGQTVANSATPILGDGGAFAAYNRAGTVDLIVDVNGWYG